MVVGATVAVAAANGTGDPVVILPFSLAVALAVFYFVDASTVAARRSDPLLRDTLRWSRVRKYLWALVVALAVVSLFANLAFSSSVKYSTFEGVLFSQSVYFVAIGLGVAALPLSALRSRDLTLRRHYRWFGMSLVFLLLFVIVVGPAPAPDFFGGTGFSSFVIADFEAAFVSMFLAAYCLYRSSRSLVPLNRMTLMD
jgi:cell division protein FtsW (lipid II flippase)